MKNSQFGNLFYRNFTSSNRLVLMAIFKVEQARVEEFLMYDLPACDVATGNSILHVFSNNFKMYLLYAGTKLKL